MLKLLPFHWKHALASSDVCLRLLFLQGNPKSYWLGGLHVPDSLLTAFIQMTSRKKGLALDKLALFTEVTELTSSAQIAEPLEHGAYLEGICIEVRKSVVYSNSSYTAEPGMSVRPLARALRDCVSCLLFAGSSMGLLIRALGSTDPSKAIR